MGGLFAALLQTTTPALDLSDLLRAEIVLAVSAFDHFIQELARRGVLEIFGGSRPLTVAYRRFLVSLDAVTTLLANPTDATPLDQEVRLRHSWLAFQKPDRVAEALRLVSDQLLWEEVAKRLGMTAVDVKTRLSAIVDRRNQIAHEADLDPIDPTRTARWPIKAIDADAAVNFLETTANAIVDVVQ